MLPSQEYLREALDYVPLTGALTWRVRPACHFATAHECSRWNTRYAGSAALASPDSKGRMQGSLDGRLRLAHRVIWKWMTGEEPPPEIDHESRRHVDNRWANLRAATRSGNMGNTGVRSDSTTGRKGVTLIRGRWRAKIGGGHLGYFDTPELASAAYEFAAKARYGAFYPGEGR